MKPSSPEAALAALPDGPCPDAWLLELRAASSAAAEDRVGAAPAACHQLLGLLAPAAERVRQGVAEAACASRGEGEADRAGHRADALHARLLLRRPACSGLLGPLLQVGEPHPLLLVRHEEAVTVLLRDVPPDDGRLGVQPCSQH
eukprot:602593-Pyramimonas_sp.AAC.1